jgi:hypothetical protein
MLGEENMERILSDWLHNLPVTWMAVLFFGCGYLTVAAIYVAVVEFPTSFLVRARALSAAMLSPLGTLFALFVVFTAAQVWNDTDRANRRCCSGGRSTQKYFDSCYCLPEGAAKPIGNADPQPH